MRRREVDESKFNHEHEIKNMTATAPENMNIRKLKIAFLFATTLAIVVYILFQIWVLNKHERGPGFPLSPEVQKIYDEYGEGAAKPRRRPDLHEDIDAKEDETDGEEAKKMVDNENEIEDGTEQQIEEAAKPLHVAIVACGDRAPEAVTSLKSFAMFTNRHLHFHVFAEEQLHKEFKDKIEQWPMFTDGRIKLDLHPIMFPGMDDFHQWKSLFKPCASQRLFLPLLLTDVDSVIYVDTDILLMRPPEDIWDMFGKFNGTQLAGLAPEGEVDAIGWYNRFARHPYYGRLGLNSGVMLMNLTRMREVKWNSDILPIYKKYRYDITWGDQCLLNIMFHFKPEQVYVFSCEWNYRPDHCMYGNNCEAASERGISIVHGNRRVFHNQKQPEFKVIYDAFNEFNFRTDTIKDLKERIDKNLDDYEATYCGEVKHIFTQRLGAV
eukprot:gene15114-16670_t